MTSLYDHVLPRAFTCCLIMNHVDVPRLAGLLVSPDAECVNGSSFAVTVDAAPPNVKVWLSEVSLARVRRDPVFGPALRRSTCD